jgi:hypothetical protein
VDITGDSETYGVFYVATKYNYRLYVWNYDDNDWTFFDTPFVAAGGPMLGGKVNWIDSEHGGRKELAKIASFKRFHALLMGGYSPVSNLHAVHTLFLLEQQSDPVDFNIQFNQWDTTAKRDDQGEPPFIELAELVFQAKVKSHTVVPQRDAYMFQFEAVGAFNYDDAPDMNN